MMRRSVLAFTAAITATLTSVLAAQQLPYNPTSLIRLSDTEIFLISPGSQTPFSALNSSTGLSASSTPEGIASGLPFLSNNTAFVPTANDDAITVLAGDCANPEKGVELWTYSTHNNTDQSWSTSAVKTSDSSLVASYLAAGFSFPSTGSAQDNDIYVFGGMCPQETSNVSSWTSQATYSNTMLTVSPEAGSDYQLSITGARAPPIAEAGLSITPLTPTSSNSSTGGMSLQQNFVLIGGHTRNAFINMSQVALFSLPEQSWAFVGINQPTGGSSELVRRDAAVVEPRSGHTAVMTEDGRRIIVFGGWVGDVSNPATPQLAVLEVGLGYGGTGDWDWRTPRQSSNPFNAGQGIYGHGAVMLPGGVMMVSGGYSISSSNSKVKRDTSQLLFYNTTSSAWISSYSNPRISQSTPHHKPSGLGSSQKAGLGAGLGLGFATAAALIIAWLLYSRRLRQKRSIREKELREMALGTGRCSSSVFGESRRDGNGGYLQNRSVSWGGRQEKEIEHDGQSRQWNYTEPTASGLASSRDAEHDDGIGEVLNSHHGLHRSLHSRGPAGFGTHFDSATRGGPGVFRIDEVPEEERSQRGSLKRPRSSQGPRPVSDPFKDPPSLEPRNEAAEKRRKEVQSWVEDWASAAESLQMSRSPSKANSRTYSNLSQYYSGSSHGGSGHDSPEKSDRTGSNLSDSSKYSNVSAQKSTAGGVSRNLSQRSASAGYALFAGAAAAMGTTTGSRNDGIDRSASKRSISTGDLYHRGSRRRSHSFGPNLEGSSLMPPSSFKAEDNSYSTPPESPVKEYKNYARTSSLTSQGKKAIGSVKRIFTGTRDVDVQGKVATIEDTGPVDGNNNTTTTATSDSPSKSRAGGPEMRETTLPRRTLSAGNGFWQHKKGAKDWEEPRSSGMEQTVSSTVRRRSGLSNTYDTDDYEGEDWDVETAIQRRVVQVMFTVPKEKLRVVNADALSLVSRSDYSDAGGNGDVIGNGNGNGDRRVSDDRQSGRNIARMSSLREEGDLYDAPAPAAAAAPTRTGTAVPKAAMVTEGPSSSTARASAGNERAVADEGVNIATVNMNAQVDENDENDEKPDTPMTKTKTTTKTKENGIKLKSSETVGQVL